MAKQPSVLATNPNIYLVVSFFTLMIINVLVIGTANLIAPENYVLGTISHTYTSALVLSSGILAWLGTIVMPLFTEAEIRRKKALSPLEWFVGYAAINFVGLWLMARLAEYIGLGISSWLFVLLLALVIDFFQGVVMMGMQQLRTDEK